MTDPISAVTGLVTGAVGGLISLIGGGGKDAPAAVSPSPPPSQPAPQAAPATERQKAKSTTPSFIGGAAVPDNRSFGTKTLLGQ